MVIGTPRSNMTRTIELPLPEELLRLVDERAHTAGLPREAYIRAVLSKDVAGGLSISEILAPFRDQVANGGVSDDDLDDLFTAGFENRTRFAQCRRIDVGIETNRNPERVTNRPRQSLIAPG